MHSEALQGLLGRAREMRGHAYAPYSHFAVGAAILCQDGSIFEGANVENASFGLSMCAERSALFSAVSAGHRRFVAIAVAGPPQKTTAPCGACRQALCEFNPALQLVYTTVDGIAETTLDRLLPAAFSANALDAQL